MREPADPVERMDEELLDVLPDSPRKPYDMYDVIGRIVDDGDWFDLKPRWARTIITCLARMGGRPVGIVANQPKHLGGILENDSADKAARFVNLCDAYGIPLLFLMDVPGFMVGTKVEQAGIIRHGAKMLYAVSRATVPKITVVIRKAYGAGYYVMNGRAYEPDLIVAWPSAEISVMGPEGAVNIIFRKQIEAAEDPDATRAEMIEGIRKTIDPYIAAGNALIDDIIDPRETRPTVIRALEMAATKRVERPVEEARGDAGLSEAKPIFFSSPQEFYDWLEEHHETETEVYVGFYKTAHRQARHELVRGGGPGALLRLDRHALEQHRRGPLHAALHAAQARQQLEQDQRREGGEADGGRADAARPASRRSSGAPTSRTGVYSFERENAELPPEYEERLRANAAAAEYFDSRPPWYRRTAIHW